MKLEDVGLDKSDFAEGFLPCVDCGSGWKELVLKALKSAPAGTKVMQIKEKWGMLRIYVDHPESTPVPVAQEHANLLMALEQESAHMCELCGESAETKNVGWVVTLCAQHLSQYKAGRPWMEFKE